MNKTFPNRYETSRKIARLTRTEAARRLHIDVRTLYGYETGQREPPKEIRVAMAREYKDPQLAMDAQSPTAAMGLFVKELEDVTDIRREIMAITYDNVISPEERPRWNEICLEVQELAMACAVISAVR